ncbi:hypothetical protein VD0002_g3034 [Verticillium dahliae]|uniref:Alcohol dehydrogenase n=2 Tax=Verticillium dahliae TaxID=27337 RepID=G2X456_VERDV|nr:alcohol dehydrogenase [Verticillium dahliae VdLs.17]KAF3351509.1 Alpha-1,2-galactosyltransferase [Verticillium dahliae VDG2]KAH6691948.1 alcohol dehydrogenase [Verticillium dahliae]EGY23355.1 alcohol dehydrogenase [Verticillium dahliae VdLs.17]PNH28584.1 hypothetical protein BJF96_g8115 [Verticillium dahliae]PNH42018.1 hypothetical protein VD0004_g5218 [Verticillium dahliae]
MALPATHPAVAVQAPRQPLTLLDVPTREPQAGEVVVKVDWASIAPYHIHQADGGLVIDSYPYILGDTFAGTVAAVGPGPHTGPEFSLGDPVVGYSFRNVDGGKEAALQTYVTVPSFLVGRVPKNLKPEEAVTAQDHVITVIHTVVQDLGLPLPWPRPADWTPPEADKPILLWGGAGSVGMYAIEILRHWGYTNLIAVASRKNHAYLRELGAKTSFDYRDDDVVEQIRAHLGGQPVPYAIDCIGHLTGTLQPITKLAGRGSKVAVMLPVIIKDASETEAPEYQMTSPAELSVGKWEEGVEVSGVRTHFYLENEEFKEKMQSEIVPTLLEQGAVRPNPHRVVEGKDLLERVENGLKLLRNKEVSGEKLVLRVSE